MKKHSKNLRKFVIVVNECVIAASGLTYIYVKKAKKKVHLFACLQLTYEMQSKNTLILFPFCLIELN